MKRLERKKVLLRGAKLHEAVDYWATLLSLGGWEIDVSVIKAEEMPDGAEGACSTYPKLNYARIQLISPDDYPTLRSPWPYDMELTLVHELLHVVHWTDDTDEDSGLRNTLHERAVETTAQALVALKRCEDE